jgi:hypothetical protein
MITIPPFTGNAELDAFLFDIASNLSGIANTGTAVDTANGAATAYSEQYLHIKYANSNTGTNLSDSPTNRLYFGVYNSKTSTESTNPADYTWYLAANGFSTTRFLFYKLIGARTITFIVTTSSPGTGWLQDSGAVIDLDNLATAGPPGSDGLDGLSTIYAYRIQDQATAPPTGFPQTTSGSNLPVGWSATIGSPTVGQIVYYTFGKYNSSFTPVGGVAANTTYWGSPVAASIFQDIRSDNWNGTTPPTAASVPSWGTAGYYIARSSGNMFANGFYARGKVRIEGNNDDLLGTALKSNENANAYFGIVGYDGIDSGRGVAGLSRTNNGVGVVGSAINSACRAGVLAFTSGGAQVALEVSGRMLINNSTLVSNLNADLLDGKHASEFVQVASGATNGDYLYYKNNTETPTNPTTIAAWIKVSTNTGGTVFLPGYL